MIALIAALAHGQECTGREQVADLDRAVGQAEIAIHGLDAAALSTALGEADASLACLREPLAPHSVARWFRAAGVQAVGLGQADRANALLRAARALEPAYRLEPDLGPPIQEAYAAAEPPTDAGAPLPPPAEGWITIDGRPTDVAPPGLPYVVQWFGSDGGVRLTRLMEAGAPPPYPLGQPPGPPVRVGSTWVPPDPVPLEVPAPPRRGHPSRVLALSGVGAGLLAGAGVAWASALKEDIVASAPEVPPSLLATNRAVGYGAAGLGVAAFGMGIGAVAVARW